MSSADYLTVVFSEELNQDAGKIRHTPFADSEIYYAPIDTGVRLTNHPDVKTVYKLSLDITGLERDFLPGDTIGILPSNPKSIVDQLFIRLNLESVSDKPCHLQILENTTKKKPTVPKHLPLHSTLRDIFLNHLDLQTPPKKLFLRALARFAEDPAEKLKLEKITSQEYLELVNGPGRSLLGLLNNFPSCNPPARVLLEHLPPLQPRPYSISSSPLLENRLEVTFFVSIDSEGKKGLCTGWLEDLILSNSKDLVPFFFRQPTDFALSTDANVPLILIATGTGIAPFRGFLQHRKLHVKGKDGAVWMLYGCRYRDKDFLYKEEIEDYVKNRRMLTRLNMAFSREGETKNYVQHEIEKNGAEFVDWIVNKEAVVFVCGDAKTTVPDVKTAIVKILIEHCDMSCLNADYFLEEMEFDGRFLVDTWL